MTEDEQEYDSVQDIEMTDACLNHLSANDQIMDKSPQPVADQENYFKIPYKRPLTPWRENFIPDLEREKVLAKENRKIKRAVEADFRRCQRTRPFLDRANKPKHFMHFIGRWEPTEDRDISPVRGCEVGIETSL